MLLLLEMERKIIYQNPEKFSYLELLPEIERVTLSTLRGLCANLFHDLLWKRLPQKQLKTPYFGVKWYK